MGGVEAWVEASLWAVVLPKSNKRRRKLLATIGARYGAKLSAKRDLVVDSSQTICRQAAPARALMCPALARCALLRLHGTSAAQRHHR